MTLTTVTEIEMVEGPSQTVIQHEAVEVFDDEMNSCGTLQLLNDELLFIGNPELAARVLFDKLAKVCVDNRSSEEYIVLSFSDDDGNLKYSAKVKDDELVLSGNCNSLAAEMLGYLKEFTDTYIGTL